MSPPLPEAASGPVNPLDTGTHGETDRRISARQLRVPAYADRFDAGRVMLAKTASFEKGATIRSRMTYALRAPDKRRIPIPAKDLQYWIDRFYKWDRKNDRWTLYARDAQDKGLWAGREVSRIPLKRGTWTVLQSDEDFAVIPQTHTEPMSALAFDIAPNGTVIATFPEKKNTPVMSTNSTQARDGGHTKKDHQEGDF